MNTYIKYLVLVIVSIFLIGCAGNKTYSIPLEKLKEVCTCPSQAATIIVNSPYGKFYVTIPKGSLDNPENWLTEEQFKDRIKEDDWQRRLERGY